MALLGSLCVLVGLMTSLTAYVYASPGLVPECKDLNHTLGMQRRRLVVAAMLCQKPFQHGFNVSYSCELEERAFEYLDEDDPKKRTCPSGYVCKFYEEPVLGPEQFIAFLVRAVGSWIFDFDLMKPADQVGCNYEKLVYYKRFACLIRLLTNISSNSSNAIIRRNI